MDFNTPLGNGKIPTLLSEGYKTRPAIAQNPEMLPLPKEVVDLVNSAKEAYETGTDLNLDTDVELPDTFGATPEVAAEIEKITQQYKDKAEENEVKPITATAVSTAAAEIEAEDDDAEDDDSGEAGFIQIANRLKEQGFITDIPATIDPGNMDIESFFTLVDHNIKLKSLEEFENGQTAGVNDLAARMSPATVEIINFNLNNPNATDEETFAFAESIMYANSISQLDSSNIYDAEVLVREYLRSTGDLKPDEIDAEIEDYRAANKLEARAQMFKPKLELKLKQQREEKDRIANEIRQREQAIENHFINRVDAILKKGEIKGIKLGDEEKAFINSVMRNNVPVPIKGGRTAEMGYLDHLTRKHRFGEPETGADLERLMLALLVMEGKDEVIKKHYATPAAKAEAVKFMQSAKNTTFKSTQTPNKTGKPNKNPDLNNKEAFFKTWRGAAK